MELARDWRTEPEDEQPARERPRALPAIAARPLGPLRSVVARAFDIGGALMLLLLTSPLIALGAVIVLTNGGRPIFFGHVRVGRGGRLFRCWKLRTMHSDAEHALDVVPGLRARYVANGYKLPLTSDPRVTRVGRVLRRRYLDELPQLINVLDGTMSLIGPRPIVPDELKNYGCWGEELLRERPGIIGAWTSRGRARPPYPERARLELDYLRNRSIRRDLAILLRALPVIVRGQEGA